MARALRKASAEKTSKPLGAGTVRNLIVVLGDQLDLESRALSGGDPEKDLVLMSEVEEEIERVPSHKLRIAFFLSAMRHFRDVLIARGWRVKYRALSTDREKPGGPKSLADALETTVREVRPASVILVEPGDYRIKVALTEVGTRCGVPVEFLDDSHFLATVEEVGKWSKSGRGFLLETFYRAMRRRMNVLVDENGNPQGGVWNFDSDNRAAFGREGPRDLKSRTSFAADTVTQEVLTLVEKRYPNHPGTIKQWTLPVEREGALVWLEEFVRDDLPRFGKWQDAMWTGEGFLYHSRLSVFLNVKLLNPREVISAAIGALERGDVSLGDVEGFVRQILGWREYMRGIYWREMPGYADLNYFEATDEPPPFFWNGETDMACLKDAIGSVVRHAYAHHIQRLMVIGLYSQLAGIHPYQFHEWHMAMYLDAVDWVSLPNTLGMSQYGDGGIVATKPYCASGNYINRMSNSCKTCRFDPTKSTGQRACPFTSLYWRFLWKHRPKLIRNGRMSFQMRNLERKSSGEIIAIRKAAEDHLETWKR